MAHGVHPSILATAVIGLPLETVFTRASATDIEWTMRCAMWLNKAYTSMPSMGIDGNYRLCRCV